MFVGHFRQSVDRNRRVSVPLSFRDALGEGARFYAFKALSEPLRLKGVVDCRTRDDMLRLQGMVEDLDPLSDEQEDLKTAIFGAAHELGPDKTGRIILPEWLMEYAEIEKECAFVGGGSSFQMFNPETYERHRKEIEPRASYARRALRGRSWKFQDAASGPPSGA